MPLQPNEVKTEHISTGAVTTPKIGDEQVTSAKIKDGAVTTEKLATGAVTTSKLAENAVTGSKIRDGVIRAGKIAPGAITTAKIGELQVTGSRIADRAITEEKIANSAVTGAKIANGSISQTKLSFTPPSVARPITPRIATDEIGDAQVTTDKIADAAVTVAELADSAVETAKLKDKAVTGAKIKDYDVGYTQIASNSINREKIINGEVLTEKIADNAVTAVKIAGGAVTPDKVDAVNTPSDGQLLSYEGATSRYKYVDPPTTAASKITLINPQTVFDETAMTDRSAPLDVSAVVPATAIGVLVELHQDGMVPGWAQPSAQVQHPLGGVALTCYITGDAVGTLPMYNDNAGIVPVYASQQIYLVINRVGVSTRVKLTVVGYVE